MTTICAYPDCGRPTFAKGWCKAHYHQAHRGQPMHPVGQRPPRPICTVPGCQRPHKAKGLCTTHYDQALRAGRTPGNIRPYTTTAGTCTVEDCDQPRRHRGLCRRHYEAARLADAPPCVTDGCTRPAYHRTLGLCEPCDKRRRHRPHSNPRPKVESRPRQAKTAPKKPITLPKGWDKPAPKPRPVAVNKVDTLLAVITPLDPAIEHQALANLRRWNALDLAPILGLDHPEAA